VNVLSGSAAGGEPDAGGDASPVELCGLGTLGSDIRRSPAHRDWITPYYPAAAPDASTGPTTVRGTLTVVAREYPRLAVTE
jgi:hypothetical protein